MAKNNYWHYRKCPRCGSLIFSKDDNAPCKSEKCAKLRKEPRHSPRTRYDPDSFIVVTDPIPVMEGGFKQGTTITQIQAECMCQVGSFTDGTILQSNRNRRYLVSTNLEGRQSLLPLT